MESGASSGGGLRHGSSASEFSSLPPLPEVDAADIWHRGTDKNIFQIVSDRLVKVVPRVMVK